MKEGNLTNNVRLIARTYDIDEILLRDWKKNEAKILKNLNSCTSIIARGYIINRGRVLLIIIWYYCGYY